MTQNEGLNLYELRELAVRQQECIQTKHQLIESREQKLKHLLHDQNLNQTIAEYDMNLRRLKESVSAQELKLKQLRTLKGQVHKHRASNANLCTELESIRTLFNEKEKELSVALTKVDALTRQLEELRKGNTTNSYHINGISNAKHSLELEKLRQELLYRSKLSEQNGHELMLKKGLLTQRQSEMVKVDKRISELQQRLARKRQLNQQLSSQMHSNLIRANNYRLDDNELQMNGVLRSSVGHMTRNRINNTMRPLSANINIAAVEPVLRDQTSKLNEFDQRFNVSKDFIGCKQDPKYQTLPYNTKFGVRPQPHHQNYCQTNQLCVSPENDRIVSEISNDKTFSTNSSLNNDNSNNNHNNSVSVITNNINSNPKVMFNTKSPLLEERPSPSGSSGSSDRASLQNHNGIIGYKMQQQIHNNMNCNSAQHPYQNLNPNMFSAGIYVEPNVNSINNKLKHNYILHNNYKINSNQSVNQSHCVPTHTPSQTQSQINTSKVPPNTKPKPIVPPKPSVPVKPSPPPRQTPNHSFSAQIHSESLDMNTFSTNPRINTNSYSKKSSNLLTNTNAIINTSNTGYNNRLPLNSVAIQKTYNAMNSKSGLMVQQLPHHCQQHSQLIQSFEDKLQSHLIRNNEASNRLSNLNETTDGLHPSGLSSTQAIDTTSSTSSVSSTLSSQPNHVNNYEMKTTDNNYNPYMPKNEDRECPYGSIKGHNKSTVSIGVNSGIINNNNMSNDWHKVKRRPVVANNEMEQELALQVSAQPKKSNEAESNLPVLSHVQTDQKSSHPQTSDCNKVDSNQTIGNKNKIQSDFDLIKSKSNERQSEGKDNESDINLIKEHKEETNVSGIDSNSMTDNNNMSKEKDCTDNAVNPMPNCALTNGMVGMVGAKRMKGSLKCHQMNAKDDHKSSNGTHPLVVSRRVSFDPLALLLDAALEGELELVKKTAKEVPNPSAANDEGITALHNAICAGHYDIVKYLVENGCDVNAQDSDGWTPLHCAASCNNLSMVKFLVDTGACIFATTLSDQETAAEKCEEDEEGFDGCSQFLYGVQEKLGILNGSQVFAVYDYECQNGDELSFKAGNVITVMRKGDEQEREWWWARINDREGYVPRNLLGLYPRVKPIKELQTIAEEKIQ